MRCLLRSAIALVALLVPASLSQAQVVLYGTGYNTFGTGFNTFGTGGYGVTPFGLTSTGASVFSTTPGITTFGAVPFGLSTVNYRGYGVVGRNRLVVHNMPGRLVTPVTPGHTVIVNGGTGGGTDSKTADRFDRIDEKLRKISGTLDAIDAKLGGGAKPPVPPEPKLPEGLSEAEQKSIKDFMAKVDAASKDVQAKDKIYNDMATALATDRTNQEKLAALKKAGEDHDAALKRFKELMKKVSNP